MCFMCITGLFLIVLGSGWMVFVLLLSHMASVWGLGVDMMMLFIVVRRKVVAKSTSSNSSPHGDCHLRIDFSIVFFGH